MIRTALLLVLMLIVPRGTTAEPVRVMVAANFRECLQVLAEQYTTQTGTEFKISHGGTGQLYAQIMAGAPCDLFFAADSARPQRLVTKGWAAEHDCSTYAIGQLMLCALKPHPNPGGGKAVEMMLDYVMRNEGGRLAIANPDLAPYGRAAVQVLRNMGRYEEWEHRLVRGQNVAQTWQFLHTGAAPLGFVARSQVMAAQRTGQKLKMGTAIMVPLDLYDPVVQQVVVAHGAQPQAREFLAFLFSAEGHKILREFGYRIPTP